MEDFKKLIFLQLANLLGVNIECLQLEEIFSLIIVFQIISTE